MPDGVSTEIFTIRARKCLRCGGLLTSGQALMDGYGHTCKMKTLKERGFIRQSRNPDTSQISLFGEEKESEE